MGNQTNIAALLLDQVKMKFRFLIECGFHFLEDETVNTPTLVEITLSGKKVALIVSFDCREQTTSLYVAKVRDGRITHRGEGGYYGDFSAYLRQYCRFRGSISDGMTIKQLQTLSLQERIRRDVLVYAKTIQAYAPRIVNDVEDFD
jgi:hypothetical protein